MISNWVVTIYWPDSAKAYLFTAFEEAFEFASIIKKDFPKNRVTIKRERRDFYRWIGLIIGNVLIV